jgi:hypothetical protein
MRSYFTVSGGKPTIEKSDRATRVYGIDVADINGPNQVINGVTANVVAGSIVTVGAATYDGTVLLVKITGGVIGEEAAVAFDWTTADGESDSRTLYFRIVSR